MKNLIKQKAPILLNFILSITHFPMAWKKHNRKDKELDYWNVETQMSDIISKADLAFSFFLDAALRNSYDTIIEIGTYDGRRIVNLKRLAKDINAFGLDIPKNFTEPFLWENVNFEKYDITFFKKKLNNALIISNGTLSYFQPEDLKIFFETIANNRYDIAFCEPITLFKHTKSIKRSNGNVSFYHPYEDLLRSHGFLLLSNYKEATRNSFSLSMCEQRYFNIAQFDDSSTN